VLLVGLAVDLSVAYLVRGWVDAFANQSKENNIPVINARILVHGKGQLDVVAACGGRANLASMLEVEEAMLCECAGEWFRYQSIGTEPVPCIEARANTVLPFRAN
jgi:hypothetical protein